MNDKGLVHETCRWCYRGVWGILTSYFKLPERPMRLPSMNGETVEYTRPSPQFLEYRKFLFWIGLTAVDISLLVLWGMCLVFAPLIGILTAPLWLAIIILPDILAYIAIHLRYDTTWYAISDRSLRIRRGIWTIHETTITFENIQNVNISQGPLQRWFGFSNLIVSTAGGGGHSEGTIGHGHVGFLEGIDRAEELRAMILQRAQRNSGLGDENEPMRRVSIDSRIDGDNPPYISTDHLELLKQIRDITSRLRAPSSNA